VQKSGILSPISTSVAKVELRSMRNRTVLGIWKSDNNKKSNKNHHHIKNNSGWETVAGSEKLIDITGREYHANSHQLQAVCRWRPTADSGTAHRDHTKARCYIDVVEPRPSNVTTSVQRRRTATENRRWIWRSHCQNTPCTAHITYRDASHALSVVVKYSGDDAGFNLNIM